jgi:hypothetical protein
VGDGGAVAFHADMIRQTCSSPQTLSGSQIGDR